MPAVYVLRHGETVWSSQGKHTSVTDIQLTEQGKKDIERTRDLLVGEGKLIRPSRLKAIYTSPRTRTRETLHLLGLGPAVDEYIEPVKSSTGVDVIVSENLREWDYGPIYEGITSAEIRKHRKSRGLDSERDWDIWRDGCEGGESPDDVTRRVDAVIQEIRTLHHAPAMDKRDSPGDVIIAGHGHCLRALAMRWIGKPLEEGPAMVLDAGAVGILTYEHNDINEPAIGLGMKLCK